MQPVARSGDLHTCPIAEPGSKPHVGGACITGSGVNVFIEGQPATRLGDLATCTGPVDTIIGGSNKVFINGRPAARMHDATAHGGMITQGSQTVFIE